MRVNSINPQYRAYSTKSVSMAGSVADKEAVVSKVKQFLKDNELMFVGNVTFAPTYSNVCHFNNVIVTGHKSPYYLYTSESPKELTLNGTSMDDIAYKFAKIAGGKTLYNPLEEENMATMYLIGGNTKGYKYKIKVPDFTN